MNKFCSVLFVFFVFISSVFVLKPYIHENCKGAIDIKINSGSVESSICMLSCLPSNFMFFDSYEKGKLYHEKVIYKNQDGLIGRIIDSIVINITKKNNVNDKLYLYGTSYNIPSNVKSIEIIIDRYYITVGTPKIL